MLAPGFVDLQVNGWHGTDFASADAEACAAAARELTATGVTALLPTLITAPLDALVDGVSRIVAASGDPAGARIVGMHVEGPFLARDFRGAHDERWLQPPTPEAIDRLADAAGGLQLLVTLAPELPGALDAIRRLTARGAVVSIGHTGATADEARAGADAGARMVTHLFNAQRGLHHRRPGVVGVALTDERLVCGLIADLHHVAPEACRIALAAARGRIALVSDATAAGGMPAGRYELGGQAIEVAEGAPPVRADGTIAGSVLAMDRAVANAVSLGLDLPSAVRAASTVPADVLGRADLGRLAPGALADMTWLSDDLQARATWVGGRVVHGAVGRSVR